MNIQCCKGCQDRYIGCHADCDRYKADRGRLDGELQKRFEYQEREYQMLEYKKSVKRRTYERRNEVRK